MSASQKKILNKLLWRGKNKGLLAGASLGAFLGLWLLLSAAQFHFDLNRLLKGDADPNDRFIQINKKVNLFNTLGEKAVFDEREIEAINRQPFIQKAGVFVANDFKAGAYSDLLGFYTELFFESVPSDFLDVSEPDFRWREGQQSVPVILSKDYLALYNFGFAPSQGLPQLTPATIQRLKMELRISGNGRQQTFEGQIVGFSERINSVLVPPDFMAWANQHFGSGGKEPSRLILKVDNPLAKDLRTFLQKHNYELSTGKLIGGQFGVLLKIVLGVLTVFGLLILLLSMLIFILNFQLLVAENADDIRLLQQTGHFPRQISGLLTRKFAFLFGGTLLAVLATMLAARWVTIQYFKNQGFMLKFNLHPLVWLLGLVFAAGVVFIMLFNMRRSVAKFT
jgi:hypothetical protein